MKINKKIASEKYNEIKKECLDIQKQIMPLLRSLKRIGKKAERLGFLIDNYAGETDLYKYDDFLKKTIENNWNVGAWFRLRDFDCISEPIEIIDNVLHNIKVTSFEKKPLTKRNKEL